LGFLISNFHRVLNVVCLGGIHSKTQFTMEKEEEGRLPFLDIDIYKKWAAP